MAEYEQAGPLPGSGLFRFYTVGVNKAHRATMLNTPDGWSEFENSVRLAVAHQSDAELANTVAKLQRNFKRDRKPSQHETLQALYTEQHRRSHIQ